MGWLWMLLVGAGLAQDGGSEEARVLYEQGLRYYQEQDYDTAISLWEKSYDLAPLPAILHNIAKAQEETNLPREALVTWKAYHEVAPVEGRTIAEARIAALEIVVAALGPVERPAPQPVPLPAPVAPDPARRERSLRPLWAGLLAAGAAGGVVSGSLLAVQARSSAATLARDGCLTLGTSTLCDDPTATGLRAEQTRFVIGAALVGGGLALGGGSVWVAVDPSKSEVNVTVSSRW